MMLAFAEPQFKYSLPSILGLALDFMLQTLKSTQAMADAMRGATKV